MRCGQLQRNAAAAVVFLLAACGGQSAVPTNPPSLPAPNPSAGLTVDGYPAKFTEYPVPGVSLADVTVGPDGAIWFANFSDFFQSTIAGGEIDGTGAFKLVSEATAPDDQGQRLLTSGSKGIAAAGGKVWMLADDPDFMRKVYLVGMTPGVATVTDVRDFGVNCCAQVVQKFATDKQGNLWVLSCPDSCEAFSSFVESFTPALGRRSGTLLGDASQRYIAAGIGFGTDGNTYVTATFDGSPGNGLTGNEGFVFKLAPNAKILAKYPLPVNTNPQGIAGGPDGNLWIAEQGAGKIVRMTPTGQTTEFPLPNPNAQPFQIIAANDGALWFTEYNGDALGRISTSGAITEYPTPTRISRPFGLVSCPAACENAHGRIWFSERGAGKIGKLEF